MSNFTNLIYAILLALLLRQAADLPPSVLAKLYRTPQNLLTAPVAMLSAAVQHGPGQGLPPSVRNSAAWPQGQRNRVQRSITLRVLPPTNILADLQAGRFEALLAWD
jgi:hypothetical protein